MTLRWLEVRRGAACVNAEGRVLGDVHQRVGNQLWHAFAGNEQLGAYTDEDAAKRAVEARIAVLAGLVATPNQV